MNTAVQSAFNRVATREFADAALAGLTTLLLNIFQTHDLDGLKTFGAHAAVPRSDTFRAGYLTALHHLAVAMVRRAGRRVPDRAILEKVRETRHWEAYLSALDAGARAQAELARQIEGGADTSQRARARRTLHKLERERLVEPAGPDSRYGLTEFGRAVVERLRSQELSAEGQALRIAMLGLCRDEGLSDGEIDRSVHAATVRRLLEGMLEDGVVVVHGGRWRLAALARRSRVPHNSPSVQYTSPKAQSVEPQLRPESAGASKGSSDTSGL